MVKVIVESGEERNVFEGNYVLAIALKSGSDPDGGRRGKLRKRCSGRYSGCTRRFRSERTE